MPNPAKYVERLPEDFGAIFPRLLIDAKSVPRAGPPDVQHFHRRPRCEPNPTSPRPSASTSRACLSAESPIKDSCATRAELLGSPREPCRGQGGMSKVSDVSMGSQGIPRAPEGTQRCLLVSESFQRLPRTSKGFHKVPRSLEGFQGLPTTSSVLERLKSNYLRPVGTRNINTTLEVAG